MNDARVLGRTAGAGGRPVAAVTLVAGARLPLAFIGLGLAALALAVVALVRAPELLLWPHLHPSVIALVHLWLPGFLLSVCCGAIYQLMPVVLGAPLRLPTAAAWVHLGLHAGGVALLVGGFAAGRFALVAAGGGAVALGTGVLLVATVRTFRASKRRDAIGWSFPLATGWLAATALFGVVLALNRRTPFLPWSVVDLLRAHAHVGLVGFFLTLLQGATFQLVPMFTMADLRRPRCVTAGLGLAQLGLLVLVPGLAFDRAAGIGAGALLLVAGVGCSGVALGATLKSRRRRVLEPGLRAFAIGAGLVALATACGVGLMALPITPHGAAAYGTLLIGGALSLMVLGMLCKIVPFLVWMNAYGPRAGRQPVPLATALGSRPLEWAWLALHGAAMAMLLGGMLIESAVVVAAGTSLLVAAVAVFLANIGRVLTHLFQPAPGAASVSP